VVEKTALAEAEVEYEDYVSDQVWVKFPLRGGQARSSPDLRGVSVLIWTTTPWTIPGNRAVSYSPKIEYGLYQVVDAPSDNWAKVGDRFLLADKLAVDVFRQARVTAFKQLAPIATEKLSGLLCDHPLKSLGGYDFAVPLLPGDHVTEDTGTGFVHTAPGHGRDDFDVWTANAAKLSAQGINTTIPYTVDADGRFTEQAPGFAGKRVLTDTGEKGDANEAVIKTLIAAGMLIARGRLKHQYPH
jgi:isoleucyl-tRNA synthetase